MSSPPVAVEVDGLALDVLHHEVGTAGLGGPAVQQSRDPWVLEGRQDLPLLDEARVPALARGGGDLDRDPLPVSVVVPHGEVDDSHPPCARARGEGGTGPMCFEGDGGVREGGGREAHVLGEAVGVRRLGGEQEKRLVDERVVAAGRGFQVGATLARRQGQGFVKQLLQARKAIRTHPTAIVVQPGPRAGARQPTRRVLHARPRHLPRATRSARQ